MTSGFVLGPGEGSAYGFHGSAAVIKASGADTLGQLGVIESLYPAGLSVHEHVHDGEDEMFYLLEGEIEVFCGEQRWSIDAGGFAFVPRRLVSSYFDSGHYSCLARLPRGSSRFRSLPGLGTGDGSPVGSHH